MTEKSPPIAARRPHADTRHGVTREDPYHWLRAENWQEVMQKPEALDPEIERYLRAENDWFSTNFERPMESSIQSVNAEIRGRMKEDDSGAPSPDGPWAYNHRMVEGEQYPVLVRTPRNGGPEQILLDCNVEANGTYFGFGGADHDPSHRLLAWMADRQGSEFYTLSIRDLETGKDTGEVLEEVGGGGIWSADSKSLYYIELDDSHRPFRVRRHVLGTAQADDEIVYEEADPGFFVGVDKTLSERFIVIDVNDHVTSEAWLIDTRNPGPPRLVSKRVSEREYDVDEGNGVLYLLTNADGAEDFKIVTAPADSPDSTNWVDLVPHRPGVLILDVFVIRDHLLRLEREDGLPRIVVRELATGAEWNVAFDEEAYSLSMSPGYEFDTSSIRFTYSSPTTPSRTYDLDLATRERVLRKEQEVPSGHDPALYETRRIFAEAPDCERVPVTLLYRKGLKLDGSAPVHLYGYGAYGHAIPASFSISVLSLVDRGMIHAIAHIRGGMEKGYRWYKLGRREHKANSFADFIAAAEKLIADGYTSKGRIVAEGGSAGGMLMGAIANLRPDLWAGIVAQVPFVDGLNTMLGDTLPLTPPEWPEGANPIARAEDYRRNAAYSPYDNVTAQDYPPLFVLAGLTDPRVTYWEPAKWVAKLRATKTGDAPLYLRTNMDAGHGGASGRFDRIKETALCYAFALSAARLA